MLEFCFHVYDLNGDGFITRSYIAILTYILKVFPPKVVCLKREEMLSLMKNSLFIQMDGVGTEEQEEGVRFAIGIRGAFK